MIGAEAFRSAMLDHGIQPPTVIEPGKLHRFSGNGKPGDDAAWCKLFEDGTGGVFGDWRSGISRTWQVKREHSPAEREAFRRRCEDARRERAAEEKSRQDQARERARAVWSSAGPAPADNPYLARKGVRPSETLREIQAERLAQTLGYTPRSRGEPLTGRVLLAPVKAGDTLATLELIDGAGRKSAIYGGRKSGGYWAAQRLPEPESDGEGLTLLIGEGVSTVLSAQEATGYAAVAALSGGNLSAVARIMREQYPRARIILLGDLGNGQADAESAARAAGALLALPDFGRDGPEGFSDFNDMARLRGPESVREVIAAAGNTDAADDPCGVSLIPASGLKPEPISWLWDGWLAVGKLHVLAGAPGTGKTTLAMEFAATITTGGRWPDGTRAEVGDVVIWSGEDDPRDTLIPRLMACGADRRRVRFVGGVHDGEGSRAFDPAQDAQMLSDAIADNPPALLLVDPIVSAVAGDSHKNAEVRRSLQPLVDLAQSRRCAVLGISHFSKGSKGADPVERVTGSLAFGALARIVLAAAKLPDEEGGGRMLARAKSNIGLDHGGFKYDLDVRQIDAGIETTRVLWAEALEGTARELLSKAEAISDPEEHGALEDAKAFLSMLLEEAPIQAKQVRRESEEAGHAWATIRRAKDVLGVEARREGGLGSAGGWKWYLPAKVLKDPYVAHPQGVSTLGKNEHLSELSTTGGDDAEVF